MKFIAVDKVGIDSEERSDIEPGAEVRVPNYVGFDAATGKLHVPMLLTKNYRMEVVHVAIPGRWAIPGKELALVKREAEPAPVSGLAIILRGIVERTIPLTMVSKERLSIQSRIAEHDHVVNAHMRSSFVRMCLSQHIRTKVFFSLRSRELEQGGERA